MRDATKRESGQTAIEFGIVLSMLLILTGGLADVGLAFFRYNAVATAARYGARWGSVVGGTCNDRGAQSSSADFCVQLGADAAGTNFWTETGNVPLQSNHAACPSDINSTFDGFYTDINSYATSPNATTIVGAVAQRIDTDTSGTVFRGNLAPGFDLSQVRVCIQLPFNSDGTWRHNTGDRVTVFVYYPFHAATPLLAKASFNLTASSTYGIE
jgi:Flp pilus assembly protein TadG